MTMTEPLHAEHETLLPGIESLRETAEAVGSASGSELASRVGRAHDFLLHTLIPHAAAEDRVLYPAVERAMNAPGATATMRRDHVEVGRFTSRLGELRQQIDEGMAPENEAAELRRVLYGLHALVTLHFAKEEETYLPVLDEHLDVDAAADLFESMHAAAEHERAHH